MATASKQSNEQQIIQAVFDEASQALDVNVIAGGGSTAVIQIVQNGVDTDVTRDTVTPANNVPIPTVVLNPSTNVPVNPASETTQLANNVLLQEIADNTATTVDTTPVFSAKAIRDYSVDPVISGNYYEVIPAGTIAKSKVIEIFDSSGQVIILATGAMGAESDNIYIMPGGNGPVQLEIPTGTRLSIKPYNTSISVGFFIINVYA